MRMMYRRGKNLRKPARLTEGTLLISLWADAHFLTASSMLVYHFPKRSWRGPFNPFHLGFNPSVLADVKFSASIDTVVIIHHCRRPLRIYAPGCRAHTHCASSPSMISITSTINYAQVVIAVEKAGGLKHLAACWEQWSMMWRTGGGGGDEDFEGNVAIKGRLRD